MSQRGSGYKRKELDNYETPTWVTEALLPHLPRRPKVIWEPACGNGKMVDALFNAGEFGVIGSDIINGKDFLAETECNHVDAIITNPPYAIADKFIEHALRLMEYDGLVAMLLRTDFDHAMGRNHLFAECRAFAKKVVLRRRIKWFADSKGSPSFNHAWFIWDWKHKGAPTLAYGP